MVEIIEQTFSGVSAEAQVIYGKRNYGRAAVLYSTAIDLAPDDLERARMYRGFGDSVKKEGYDALASTYYGMAIGINDELVQSGLVGYSPNDLIRERAATRKSIGRSILATIFDNELGHIVRHSPKEQAALAETRRLFALAAADIQASEEAIEETDQYRKNCAAVDSVMESLLCPAGHQPKVLRQLARQAIYFGLASENKGNPTSANLGFAYRYLAKARGVYKGIIALRVAHLATPSPSPRRTRALKLAQKVAR